MSISDQQSICLPERRAGRTFSTFLPRVLRLPPSDYFAVLGDVVSCCNLGVGGKLDSLQGFPKTLIPPLFQGLTLMVTTTQIMASSLSAIEHWNRTPLFISAEERYSTYPWLYEAAEFKRHAGERVLEIGCGTGCDLLQFAMHGAQAVGVDITSEHLRLAIQRVGQMAEVQQAEAVDLPFPDQSFDYVYSHGVLHHIEEPRRVVEEIFRVLRPGGRFNVQVYARWSYFTLLRILQHGRDRKLWIENSRDPVHIDFYTARKLRHLFTPARLEIEKFHCGPLQALAPVAGFYLVAKGSKPL